MKARHLARTRIYPSERGQILIAFALAFALFLLTLFSLVVDLADIYVHSTDAEAAAQVAAQSGANDINSQAIYTSLTPTLSSRAYATCEASASFEMPGSTTLCYLPNGTVTDGCPSKAPSSSNTVEACVTDTFPLPLRLFGLRVTVRGWFDAAPVAGTTVPTAP